MGQNVPFHTILVSIALRNKATKKIPLKKKKKSYKKDSDKNSTQKMYLYVQK